MDQLKKIQKEYLKTYAFIDSQNLNLGIRSLGWRLDWQKFRRYLRNKYQVTDAYLFIGYKPGNEGLYTDLQKMGYLVILKPTMELPDKTVKGNVDAELVLHSMIQFENYERAIIVSGDGDFFCLVEYLESKKKLLHIFVPSRRYSRLFKKYAGFVVRMDWLRGSLEFKK